MIKPAVLDAMVAAGCSSEQIAAAVKADQARSSGAERQARYRARRAEVEASHVTQHNVTGVTVTDKVSPKKETSPTPPKEKTTPSNLSSESARGFDQFWSIFPNRVGKGAAEKAFAQALKRAPLEAILLGVERYAAKTDDRPWCNPATFLNQTRWEDRPAAPIPRAQPPPKPKTLGDVFREDAKRMGLIPNEQPHSPPERLAAGDGSGQGSSPGIARRFTLPSNVLGELG